MVVSSPQLAVVTIKLNGKSFMCTGFIPDRTPTDRSRKKRCRSKNFFVFEQTDIEGTLADLPYYQCVVCGTQREGGPNSGIEENVPMRNDWRTPNTPWQTLYREYKFNIDAAADEKNRKCSFYFGPEDGSDPDVIVPPWADALKLNWFGHDVLARQNYLKVDAGFRGTVQPKDVRVFFNPPYNPKGSIETWLNKAVAQAAQGVFSVGLIPMASSVAWFNDLVVPYAEWHTWRGRIAFEDPAGISEKRMSPKQDNLLVIYNPYSDRIGHTAVRDAKTGEKLWERSDV